MAIAVQILGQLHQGDIGLLLHQLTDMLLHRGGNAGRRPTTLSLGRQAPGLALPLQEFFHKG